MNANELLERARKLWPVDVPTDNEARTDYYWPLEDRIRGDGWLELGAWSFHQALDPHAKTAISQGKSTIPSSVVTIEEFDIRMRRNMRDESWDELRPLYNRS